MTMEMSKGNNLHEMSKPVFWNKLEEYFETMSAEIITQHAEPYIVVH